MIYSYQWLKKIINLPERIENIKDFQSLVSTRIAEVEEVISVKDYLYEVEVVEILAFESHPQADQLRLVTIQTREGQKTLVCGDLTLKQHDCVPYAKTGVRLPDFTLEAKKIRGILSEGMLCSAKELRLHGDEDGVMRLDKKYFGQTLNQIFSHEIDYLLHIDNKSITHRPDLWGHYGFARELALVFNLEFKEEKVVFVQEKKSSLVKISDKDCLAFYGIKVEGVRNEESPLWLKKSLENLGQKSHNNLVDLSNYILFHWGLPIHFFDQKELKFPLEVRKAQRGETIELMDGEVKTLEGFETILVDEKPLILSGIKGGKKSSISDETKSLFIEVANWDASSIRKTSSYHHLRTEASTRFEKAQDSRWAHYVLQDLEKILKDWFPKAHIEVVCAYEEKKEDLYLPFKKEFFESKLGIKIEEKLLNHIFSSLGFEVQKDRVKVPSFRATKDITHEIDLVEEFARHYGYNNITSSPLKSILKPEKFSDLYLLKKQIRSFLVHHARAYDILTPSFVSKERVQELSLEKSVKTLNPVSKEAEFLRENLLVSHLKALDLNAKQENFFQFFEIGKVYNQDNEQEHLGFMMFHEEEKTFLTSLSVLENLLTFLRKPYILKENKEVDDYKHQEVKILIAGKEKGSLFSLKPSFLRKKKIKGFATYLEMNLEDWVASKFISFKAFPHTPQVHFDFTLIQRDQDPSIVEFLEKEFKKEIEKVRLLIKYPLAEEKYAVTLRVFFKNEGKTYTSEEIKSLENRLLEACSKNLFELKKN